MTIFRQQEGSERGIPTTGLLGESNLYGIYQERPVNYTTFNGYKFSSPRSDLKGGVTITRTREFPDHSDVELVKATMDFAHYFTCEVMPFLYGGFAGFDAVEYKLGFER